jgi:hypothetical protein
LDGTPKPIEVKTTSSKPEAISFHLSAGEYNKGKLIKNYHLYIVFEAKTNFPKIWAIKNPFALENKGVTLTPSNYRVTINTVS